MESAPAPAGCAARQAKLDALRLELEGVGDSLGHGIEAGIIDAVATFGAAGFNTTGSCEGHGDRALPYPWIDFGAPGKPEFRTDGDRRAWEAAISKVRAATGVADERELRAEHWDELEAALLEQPSSDDEPPLPEWLEWIERERAFQQKVFNLVARYNAEPDRKGIVALPYLNWARIVGLRDEESALVDTWRALRAWQPNSDEDWAERGRLMERQEAVEAELDHGDDAIARRRAVLNGFAAWVKERWLEGEDFQ